MNHNFVCSMCNYGTATSERLLNHVVRLHRHDPQFQVQCKYRGCGATFKKWNSFKQHQYRAHPGTVQDLNLDDGLIYNEDAENILPQGEINDGAAAPFLEDLERGVPVLEQLEWHAAQFLINIRENCKTSQVGLERIIDGTTNLFDSYMKHVITRLRELRDPDTNAVSLDEIERVLDETASPSDLFSSVQSKKSLDKILVGKFNMVEPEEIKMGGREIWKSIPRPPFQQLVEIEDKAYIIPFIKNLTVLLYNDEIRHQIDNPRVHENGVYRTVLDGSYYRENEFFKDEENPLAIILYYDDVGFTNPLGSRAGKHKLGMFYWTLGNIDPKFRSSLDAIQLLAIVEVSYLKKYGFHKLLRSFVDDINYLKTEGITLTVNGEQKNYKGSILFCAGDNPAAAAIGGFKESVSAYRFCRSCLTTRTDWQQSFTDRNFEARIAGTHDEHLALICEPNVHRNIITARKTQYGINGQSPLREIENFDVTRCLPQDVFHILLEGQCDVVLRALLRTFTERMRIFSLDELNEQIANFHFKNFSVNKPAPIGREHIMLGGSLRQSGSQMYVLMHTFPFLIFDWIIERDDVEQYLSLHTRLLQILNVCLAYEIHEETVDMLTRMIELYCIHFNELFPGLQIPKFHFLIHLPRYIRLFGPPRQQWTMRFEGAHNYFKSLISVIRNFKNISYSLSYRFQARLSSRLATCPGTPSKKFLYQGDEIKFGRLLSLENLTDAALFHDEIDDIQDDLKVLQSPKITSHGSTWETNSLILLECSEDSLPEFGKVISIVVINNEVYFIYTRLDTLYFEDKVNAYRIALPIEINRNIIKLINLSHPHSIPMFKTTRGDFALLIDHERTEFFG